MQPVLALLASPKHKERDMSEFKSMVKMMTDEPSVILKLKKGGKVAKPSNDGFKPMKKAMGGPSMMAAMAGAEPMVGRRMPPMAAAAPKKPSMSARKRAMMAEKMMAAPMKSGGKADSSQDKAMVKKAMGQHDKQQHKGKDTMLKLKHGGMGHYAEGGGVTSPMTKTTVSDSVAEKYKRTLMHGTPKGKTSGTTGNVKMGNVGGYKDGGTVGDEIPSGTNKRQNRGIIKNGGTIDYNAKDYLETQVHTATKNKSSGPTGGVKNGNAGGFKTGGVAMANAGGYKNGGMTMVEKNGKMVPDFAADGMGKMKKGGKAMMDGGMMGGGMMDDGMSNYKKGGSTKKAYATGGTVDTGKPVALKQGNVHSGPKTNINFSGVYKEGGKVTGNTIPNKRLASMNDAQNASAMKNAKMESRLEYPKTTAGKQKTPKFC
jgi:hypothetical protein